MPGPDCPSRRGTTPRRAQQEHRSTEATSRMAVIIAAVQCIPGRHAVDAFAKRSIYLGSCPLCRYRLGVRTRGSQPRDRGSNPRTGTSLARPTCQRATAGKPTFNFAHDSREGGLPLRSQRASAGKPKFNVAHDPREGCPPKLAVNAVEQRWAAIPVRDFRAGRLIAVLSDVTIVSFPNDRVSSEGQQ